MASLRSQVESWIKDQAARVGAAWHPPPLPKLQWLPWKGFVIGGGGRREQERRLREEYERRRRKLQDLCSAVNVESIADLQEVLCSMVLSECVYKRPASEMIRYINKFKSDFGGQIVSLERVQPSLDHVPHRYLLAEAGDTLYATFIGTKQYRDVIADANILQGAIFHEDNNEDFDLVDVSENDQSNMQRKIEDNFANSIQGKPKRSKKSKPAAHRGFLARAKGIPALELYKLAQKKNRKLVLCGHSLGGAVAALSTLAILRLLASSTLSKEKGEVQVKCITFSQPPVGNAALRDYVHQKGWQSYFKSYCIPEDLVPRILSPAYFHHYNAQALQTSTAAKPEDTMKVQSPRKPKENDGEQLVLGVGPVQTSFWRLSRLVPLEGVRKHLDNLRSVKREASSETDHSLLSKDDESEAEAQSLEIQEGSEGISLAPFPDTDQVPVEPNSSYSNRRSNLRVEDSRRWRKVPYLPSYVPFGQLYLLGDSIVKSLSDAEYSKMTSVRSVITELKERFQSHSMKSYRSRFQKIYDLCMSANVGPFMGIEQLPQFPHLQQLLGLAASDSVELGNIVEPPVIRTATSVVPLGWAGVPGDKNSEPLKVDIIGHGLHLCTLVQAQVNGSWCSTAVESLPPPPPYSSNPEVQPLLQKMRILVGAPLKSPPKYPIVQDNLLPIYTSPVTECSISISECKKGSPFDDRKGCSDGLDRFIIYCTSDFITASKEVHLRTRRVRLLGFEGSGKTSLFRSILGQSSKRENAYPEIIHPHVDIKEGVTGGVCYLDSTGVNLQDLHLEATRFKEELQMGLRDLSRKTDLIILVHNLSQKIPRHHQSNTSPPQPALSLLLNEAKALGIPWIFAMTNKFSVSAHQQNMLISSAMEAYQASPNMTKVLNSSPFFMPTTGSDLQSLISSDEILGKKEAVSKFNFSPINLVLMPFQRKAVVMPVEGVTALRELVHQVLRSNEEVAFQELAGERLSIELAREKEISEDANQKPQKKGSSTTAAAVGASLGAGLGLVMAVVMGAASALRKP
ncbi:uncharacterized protein [Typha angustifolia]|uniref:uncharacterized protein isoform X1 n=1 Tax=Typha angustifolia TaxID=59011 RepID=UPI003C2C55CB